jgi:hypothetical protein
MSSGAVTKISMTKKQGLYAPLTEGGSITVDGVLASNYVSLADTAQKTVDAAENYVGNEETLFHWWLAPYRMMCLGISSNLCSGDNTSDSGYVLSFALVKVVCCRLFLK